MTVGLGLIIGFLLLSTTTHGFSLHASPSHSRSTTHLQASSIGQQQQQQQRREKILNRRGSHFDLNRFSGRVEFGSTTDLVTNFDNGDIDTITQWLSDEKQIALSIWDEDLLTDLGNSVYRLQLMTLQFVTIQLAPKVDTKMWTVIENGSPVFKLQSGAFDPNIQLLPGLNIPAEALGIKIEVVGELRPLPSGKGVTGKIGFVSGGDLPPPLRILPSSALKSASDLICTTVTNFAKQNFQSGAKKNYQEFRASLKNK